MAEAVRSFLTALWDDDGVDPDVRAAVLLRHSYHCTRCGALVIARKPCVVVRNEDAGPVAENLVTACGLCRPALILREYPEDRRNGLWLWLSQDPAATPLRRHGSDHPEWLGRDGGVSFDEPMDGAA
jgi:hypothetical protein